MLPWTLPLAFHPSVTSDAERDWRQPRTLGWELLLHSTQATSCRTEALSAYHIPFGGDDSCSGRRLVPAAGSPASTHRCPFRPLRTSPARAGVSERTVEPHGAQKQLATRRTRSRRHPLWYAAPARRRGLGRRSAPR